jgi:polyisoprenoid-binding protein YceI
MTTTTDTRTALPVGTWTLDPVHSTIGFEVEYLGGTFRGQFRETEAKLVAEGDSPVLSGSAKVASVDVKDENLNVHLQSPDFFDAERYPELSFESSDIRQEGDEVVIRGGITIRGVEKPIELRGTIGEPITDYAGRERIGLKLETTVDRTEFGVDWNAPLPDGNQALRNDVSVAAELYLVKEA